MQRSCGGHHQIIPQIAIPSDTAHLGQGKAFDGRMFITVPRTVVASGNGIGADLRHAPRRSHTRKGLSQPMFGLGHLRVRRGSNKRIYILRQAFPATSLHAQRPHDRYGQHSGLLQIHLYFHDIPYDI